MDVRQLRNFVKIVELGSFSRAAEVLRIAQPALGMQIRKLEDELHTQLLSRHSRGVEATPAGHLLKKRALAIIEQMQDAKQAVRDFEGPPSGTVKVGITPSTHASIPVRLMQRCDAELRTIRIEVQEAMTATLLDWVRDERVDLGLLYISSDVPEHVVSETLLHENAVFLHGTALPATNPTITLAEVCQHTLVMPAHPHHLRQHVQALAGQAGLDLSVRYEIGAIGTILEMVEQSIACTVLPFGAVERHVAEGRVVARAIIEPEVLLTLALVRSPRRPLSKAQVLLRGLVADIVTQEQSRYQRVKSLG